MKASARRPVRGELFHLRSGPNLGRQMRMSPSRNMSGGRGWGIGDAAIGPACSEAPPPPWSYAGGFLSANRAMGYSKTCSHQKKAPDAIIAVFVVCENDGALKLDVKIYCLILAKLG